MLETLALVLALSAAEQRSYRAAAGIPAITICTLQRARQWQWLSVITTALAGMTLVVEKVA